MRTRVGLAALVVLSVLCFTGAARAAVCAPPNSRPLGPGALQWRRWEMPLTSQVDYFGPNGKGNPPRDLLLKVTFTQCDVAKPIEYRTRGFWYGLAADGQTLDVDGDGKGGDPYTLKITLKPRV